MTEKIVSTALKLFCEKGYYNTTTNEIAKEAGISIGSLYSYYKDKDTIFLEILNRYHENFLTVFEKIRDDVNQALYKQDKRAWLRILLDELVDLHLSVKTLNRELKGLYYIKDEVREIMDQQSKKIQAETFELLSRNPDEIHSGNLEIMSLLIVDFISPSLIVLFLMTNYQKIRKKKLLLPELTVSSKYFMNKIYLTFLMF